MIPHEADVTFVPQSAISVTTGTTQTDNLSWMNITGTNPAVKVSSTSANITSNLTGNFLFEGNNGGGFYSKTTGSSRTSTVNFSTSSSSDYSLFIFRNNKGNGGISSDGYSSSVTMTATKPGGIFFIENTSGGLSSYGTSGTSSVNLSAANGSIAFIKNTGNGGGGIRSVSSASSTVNLTASGVGDILFEENISEANGGGILSMHLNTSTSSNSTLKLSANTGSISFNNNSARNMGGGIYSNSGNSSSLTELSVVTGNISFNENTSTHAGGGMYSGGPTIGIVKLSVGTGNISFNKNSSGNEGAGLLGWGGTSSLIDLSVDTGDISFCENIARGDGAGVYSSTFAGSSTIKLSTDNGNILFDGNIASGNGAGIYSLVNVSSTVDISAGNDGQIIFQNNKRSVDFESGVPKENTGIANAVYFNARGGSTPSFVLNINIGENGKAIFYDPITATTATSSRVEVNLNADDNTGLFLFDGQDYLNADAVNRYYDMINDTVLNSGTLAIANNVIYGRDLADSTMIINEGATLLSVQSFDRGRVNNIINADVTLNNSVMAFINEVPDTYHTLNINSLSGSGDIYMNFDSTNGDKDILNITDTAAGNHEVQIAMTGNGAVEKFNNFISVENPSEAVFSGEISYKNFYNYVVESANADNTSWDLVRSESDLADVVFSSTNAASLSWFGQLNNINSRMRGILFDESAEKDEAIWIRGFGNNIKADLKTPNNITFVENNYGTDAGIDFIINNGNTKLLAGLYGGYMRADRNFSNNTGTGNMISPYGGFYGTFINNNGFYIDVITKVQDFNSKFNGQADSGDFRNTGFGGSVEIGKSFSLGSNLFIEPRLQAGYAYLTADDFVLKGSEFAISVDDTTLYRFLGGFRIGQNITVGNSAKHLTWYLSADVENQTTSGGEVTVGGSSVYNYNTDGTRTTFGVGLSYNDSASSKAHIDIESSFGEKYKRVFGVSVGYASRF